MSAADQAWASHVLETQLENIAADARDIWKRTEQIEKVINEQADKINGLVSACSRLINAYNPQNDNVNKLIDAHNKLCEVVARSTVTPSTPSPPSKMFGHVHTGVRRGRPPGVQRGRPPKAGKPRKPNLKVVKDDGAEREP
jgi:hypothetical protein